MTILRRASFDPNGAIGAAIGNTATDAGGDAFNTSAAGGFFADGPSVYGGSGRSARFTTGATAATAYKGWSGLTPITTPVAQFYLYMDARGSSVHDLLAFLDGTTLATRLRLQADGDVVLINGATNVGSTNNSMQIPLATLVRFELEAILNTAAGAGYITARWYEGDSKVPLGELTAASHASARASASTLRFGVPVATANMDLYIDEVMFSDDPADLLSNQTTSTPITVTPDSIPGQSPILSAPTVTIPPGAITVSPPVIGAAPSSAGPVVTLGPPTISPSGPVGSAPTPRAPTVTRGAIMISPAKVTAPSSLGSPTVLGELTVSPALATYPGVALAPVVTGGPIAVTPDTVGDPAVAIVPRILGDDRVFAYTEPDWDPRVPKKWTGTAWVAAPVHVLD